MSKFIKVLIIEDSEDDTLLILREIKRNGYEPVFERVDTAKDMSFALDNQIWDIILADYVMPRFNGRDALKLLQEKELDLPFIVISGKIGEDTAIETMKEGAKDYIMKGNLARLIPVIERELSELKIRSEKRQLDESLKKCEKKMRKLRKIPLYMAILINKDGAIETVNKTFTKVYAQDLDKLIGKSIYDFLPFDFSKLLKECISEVIRFGEPVNFGDEYFEEEYEKRYFDNCVYPIFDSKGNLVKLAIFAWDIIQRKWINEYNFLNAKEELLAMTAHDLKSPLSSIIGYADLLISSLKNEDISSQKLNYTTRIRQTGDDMLRLINNLLNVSRIDLGNINYKFELFNLSDLLKELKDIFNPLISLNKISLDFSCPKETYLKGDRDKIKEIFYNFISNSIRYTPENGIIQISCNLQGEYVFIEIADNGCGISKYKQSELFKKFTQINGEKSGTGLGLYIAKKFLEGHNSDVQVESEEGKGAKFFFRLPGESAKILNN